MKKIRIIFLICMSLFLLLGCNNNEGSSDGTESPVVDFSASYIKITEGESVTFTDLSTNTPTSWSWTFEGGTPSSSNAENPSVIFSVAGTYKVALTATNSNGSNTETKGNYITVSGTSGSSTIYVDENSSSGSPDGTSWSTAYTSLADALGNATSDQEIWVAQGTYYPTDDTDRTTSFTLIPDVDVYGGFIGDETSRDARDWESNVTILTGDIGTAGVSTDNSYHVVTGSDDAILDGFTIQGGYANGNDSSQEVLVDTPDEFSNTEILRIVTGIKYRAGGGLYNVHAGTVTRNCIFKDNYAGKGGAVYNMVMEYWNPTGTSLIGDAPSFENCTFNNNYASGRGGAVNNDFSTSTTFTNCVFSNNICDSKGGAVYADMGCPIYFINVLFSGNKAERGGALVADGSSSHRGVYTTFVNNTAYDLGSALYQGTYNGTSNNTGTFSGNEVHLYNSVVIGNSSNSSSSSISNWHDDIVNFDNVSIVETTEGVVTISDYLDSSTYESLSADYGWQEGRNEDTDDWITLFDADSNRIYIAYSYDTTPSGSKTMIYVDADATTGNNDGTSWTDAYVSLSDALDAAATGAKIWVAEGTYTPTTGTDRTKTFIMKEGVSIYGGFDGTELIVTGRDYENNITTLSGDIGTIDDNTDNSYHVLFGATDAVLDGFTVQDGNADGDFYHSRGGGLLCYGEASPEINNCTFQNNTAIEGGAITTFNYSAPIIDNCIITNNTAMSGAGILFRTGPDTEATGPQVSNTEISSNTASDRGGAVYIDYGVWPTFDTCIITNNQSIGNGGGVYVDNNSSQYDTIETWFNSCNITNNSTEKRGGGFAIYEGILHLTDTTITGNEAKTGGGGIALDYKGEYDNTSSMITGNASTSGENNVDDDT